MVHRGEWVNLLSRRDSNFQFGRSRWDGRQVVVVVRAGFGSPGRGRSLNQGKEV